LIDIGSRELKQEEDLRKIPENISCYPPQAFLCQLEDIKPLNDQPDWSEDTIVYFKGLSSCLVRFLLQCLLFYLPPK